MRRLTGAAAAATATLLTLTACSGSDDDGGSSDDEPSLGSPSPSVPAADDKADIEAVIAAYDRALVTVNRAQQVTDQLSAVATDAWAEQLVTTYEDNLFSNDLTMVGRWRTEVEAVTVDGDSAEAQVCADGNKVYVVESGGPIPSGAQSQGRSGGVISLVREDDGWQVDGNATGEGKC